MSSLRSDKSDSSPTTRVGVFSDSAIKYYNKPLMMLKTLLTCCSEFLAEARFELAT